MEIDEIVKKLSEGFSEPEITALLEMINVANADPDYFDNMIEFGMNSFGEDKIKEDMNLFYEAWSKASRLLGDTPEGKVFEELCQKISRVLQGFTTILN